jgi:hypothetical protein
VAGPGVAASGDDHRVAQLPEDVRSALHFFAFSFANDTLVLDLLEDFDYRSIVMEYGSGLEQVFKPSPARRASRFQGRLFREIIE